MEILVYLGSGLAVLGLLGLIWCILLAIRAKREGLDESALKARLQGVVALNMGALFVSALGLMMVVVGVLL